MQIDLVKNITNEWMPITDVMTPEENVTYHIQNRGADILIAVESSDVPTDDYEAGILVLPYKVLKYTLGEQTLYLRSFNRNCAINITQVG